MKAVVMAGGAGSRLRPLTIGRPKPMIPLVNKPVMGHILDLLKKHNIFEVIITVQYRAGLIQDFFGDGSGFGLKIDYSVEESPLGTAGSVKNAQNMLDDTFLVISGDALTNFNLTELVQYHKEKNTLATLAVYKLSDPVDYGIITRSQNGQITRFQEKPGRGLVMSDYVNTGIYVLEPEILDYFPPNTSFDFANDLFPLLYKKGYPLYSYDAKGYWCDVGNIAEYMRATANALSGLVDGIDLGEYRGDGIWAGTDLDIADNVTLEGPIYLGNSVQIKSCAVIRGPTVIRDYTVVDNEAHIDRSIIWRNCYIGERVQISGTIIERQCSLKAQSTVFEGAVIGDGTVIGRSAVIQPGVKIWPGKEIEPGATINSSLIWGSQGRRVLFGRYCVSGVVNIDLTPEFSAKMGAAFGATLPKGSTVTLNRDTHRSSRMIKRAIISGLPSSGVDVLDLRSQPIPVARYFTRICKAVGGIHVRLAPHDERALNICFMDENGLDLDKNMQRTVERVFFREDFRRVYLNDIGNIEYAQGIKNIYIEDFLKVINTKAIKDAALNLVVDFADAPTADVLPFILNELNCKFVAINANISSPHGAFSQLDFQTALKQMQIITSALDTQLGVYLNPGGEKISLADDNGNLLKDHTTCAAVVQMALKNRPGGVVVLPANLSSIFEQIAEQHNGTIIRTEIDRNALITASFSENVIMASDGEGHFIFPDFHNAVDGMMALAKILEFMATQEIILSDIVANLPACYIAERKVSCVWETKATVMRLINERFESEKEDTIDNGIKLVFDSITWVLIVPDPSQPFFQITVEARSQEEAEKLADSYAHIVEKISPI